MEALLIILSILLIAGGVIFSILPPLPGPLLTYGAMICTHAVSNDTQFSTTSFIVWAIIGIIIMVADFILPVAATKKFGGTKAGVIGGMIGVVAGILLPIPFGIILGPLLGAIIGDLYGGNRIKSAFKSGFGSFLGFLVATSLKLFYSIILGGIIVYKVGGFTANAIMQLL
ncbi:hypothetical protein SAMN05421640_0630 [Ekhidna lutea]|uniref:DUF456 domain-containing protein n=1 Tax=Ekhidna lutea TaxID=447679 RepID=A0A239FDQ4_EKHLU|nr:DUF456 domain-containing protein [Ekhidna lutea]SNS55160.1 hypothetical protein SAMN05421640_0630 [Ekhidna lutea]